MRGKGLFQTFGKILADSFFFATSNIFRSVKNIELKFKKKYNRKSVFLIDYRSQIMTT